MPPQLTSNQQTENIELQRRDLEERYILGLQNLAVTSQQAKMNKTQSWGSTDKLVNDFFTFSLITLGVMATVLTAKEGIIGSKPLFYLALGLQAFVVIFASAIRLYIDGHAARTANKIFEEFNNRISKIDLYRLAITNSDEAERTRVREQTMSAFAPEYEFRPRDDNWILKNGQKTVVCVFIAAFLFFIISLVFSVGVAGK